MSFAGLSAFLTTCFLVTSDMDLVPVQPGMDVNAEVSATELPHRWLTSYEEARLLSARTNLPLLLHFDASWCGACRRMEAEVLNRTEITEQLGKSVIGVRIDADRYKELITEYGISTLPTEIVVRADGTRADRFVGAVSLSQYTQRLKKIGSDDSTQVAETKNGAGATAEDAPNVRSCLIVRHDGKMVGLGGYSPVALTKQRKWVKGSDQFVVTHEGVEYFLQSEQEVTQFTTDPNRHIPKLHGCDLVELQLENRATAGAIEYGSFYRGQVFFFASLENRDRFENNPTWYLGAMTDARTANDEMFPFLARDSMDN